MSKNRVNGAGQGQPKLPSQPKRVRRTITDKAEEFACRIMVLRTSLAALRREKAELEQRVAEQQLDIANLKGRIALFETAQEDADNATLSKEFGLPANFQFQSGPDGSWVVEHDAVEETPEK